MIDWIITVLLCVSFGLNLLLGFILLASEDDSDLKVENKKLEMENIVLNREVNNMRDLFHYMIDNDVRIDKSDEEMVIIYKKQEDNLKEILEGGLGIK